MRTRWFIGLGISLLILAGCSPTLSSSGTDYSTAVERDIPVGQTLPGTDIRFVGKTDQGAQMSIGGQMALKKTLDSLTWRGESVPGVTVDYNLRVLSFDSSSLKVGGTAQVKIANPNPKPVPATALPKNAVVFKGAVAYDVPKGKTIPSTTVTYDGKTPDGAKLGGIEGYPYRHEADSIVWTGQLVDKLYAQLDLRTVIFSDTSLKTTGTVTLMLAP